MARALQDILTELNSVYNPQKDLYNTQLAQIDPQQQAEEKGLEAAKQDAFTEITNTANRRGLFYSGIPIAEEQKYTGAQFLPALANLKGRYAQQKFNLQDALAKINQEQYLKGQQIYQSEQDRDAASRASSAGLASPSFGFGGGSGGTGGYGYQQSDKGFSFVDPYGNPVSAADYAHATGKSYRQLLQQMASAGDKGAAEALNYVGDDYTYYADPNRLNGNVLASLQALGAINAYQGGGSPVGAGRGGGGGGGGGF